MRYTEDGQLVVAHRGGAGLRPENTLAAFACSVSLGVLWLESDVRASADGVAVLHHERADREHHRRHLRRRGERLRDAQGLLAEPEDADRDRGDEGPERRQPEQHGAKQRQRVAWLPGHL